MADAREQGDVEFVHEVTAQAAVAGDRRARWACPRRTGACIHELAERNTSGPGPRRSPRSTPTEAMNASIDMAMYAIEFAGKRRAEPPREDLTTRDPRRRLRRRADERRRLRQLLRPARHRRQRHDQDDAGVGPARAARAPRPAGRAARRPVAASPARSRRSSATPTRSTTSGAPPSPTPSSRGTQIAAGEKVAMYYTSANRDEDVFDDPQRFDIHRHPNPHLSFGIGEHFCLGVHLARLEGKVFFEELLATFPTIELTGDPVRIRSNLNNALEAPADPPRHLRKQQTAKLARYPAYGAGSRTDFVDRATKIAIGRRRPSCEPDRSRPAATMYAGRSCSVTSATAAFASRLMAREAAFRPPSARALWWAVRLLRGSQRGRPPRPRHRRRA